MKNLISILIVTLLSFTNSYAELFDSATIYNYGTIIENNGGTINQTNYISGNKSVIPVMDTVKITETKTEVNSNSSPVVEIAHDWIGLLKFIVVLAIVVGLTLFYLKKNDKVD